MKKPKRRINKNYALRNELIAKGHIIPVMMVPKWLKDRGFLEASKMAADRLAHGLRLHSR